MQVESTVAMQNIAPRVKAIQEEYKGRDQQEMQIKVGQLYKEAGINPLAGCLPTLATLPVWIGLYRYPSICRRKSLTVRCFAFQVGIWCSCL